ncbi:hypothetical protein VC0101557_18140 [Vibrio cholerae VC0101557]|uniref:Uncharacterized protein n=1 Tax=Vibrio cholerae (strain MO10) TaxID=345072 RepID=A0A0X1KVE2_VIBCO|nr:hypothetical protein ASZ80_01018 [Vibrio cholerae]EET22238.1 conserved hypothetical protein [Vibrio cholerae MO10]EEY49579.1 hypothetical protein VIG_000456 [Vibrio cholerae INDRE 91/1]EGR03290.1 hypothetical protein VCHC49A2_2024 [Vibrio cholerae HC-49A2]EGS49655.1 hypothetical protein VCHC70A1_1209 [Vibrio cholerae HC-70A1]EGS50065.1 hypothetical protein VCHC48A1_1142 [Vibrio cholerae HC-48A1]EGS50877.1 hypothetical protein VCHC40A1_1058 [Vibrio cholerae HC-40A1]EGS71658.1 hypothetical 
MEHSRPSLVASPFYEKLVCATKITIHFSEVLLIFIELHLFTTEF